MRLGLAYKKCVLNGCCVGLRPKWRQQDWKHVTDYSLTTKAKVMIFCTALSRGTRVGCITTTQNWKASHLNSITPLLPERKNPDSAFCWKMHAHSFLGLQRHHSPWVYGQRYKNQLFKTYVKTLKRLKKWINHVGWWKKPILQHDNARPHTSAATSAAVDSIEFEVVPHPPYSPDLAPSDFWLFGALKKHIKGNRFTCDEEVQPATAKWFWE
jgi:hypothetical protein